MNAHTLEDPWRKAADEASGFEGQRWSHNLKSGLCLVGSVQTAPDFRAVFLMETATHGRLKFIEGELVDKDIRRFAIEAPGQDELPESWTPSTGCLCVGEDGQLLSYAGASWGVRGAFVSQLVKPYARLNRVAFPLVSLGFGTGLDSFGNHRPMFNILGWRPRKDFAAILGEGEPAAQLPGPRGPDGPPLSAASPKAPRLQHVDGPPADRDAPPPIEENDYADAIDDDIPF
jgi:hypothetical protein